MTDSELGWILMLGCMIMIALASEVFSVFYAVILITVVVRKTRLR